MFGQGTNEFHGSVLSLIRNSALVQKSYFVRTGNLPKPDFVAFGGISGDRRLAEFLRPTSAGAARALQIGARYAF